MSQAVSMSAPQLPLPTRRFPGFAHRGALPGQAGVDITRYYIGVALAETGNMRAALPMLAETVGEAAAYYNIGVILCKAGYWEQGESQFHTALELNPRMSAARRWLHEIQRERATVVPAAKPQQIRPTTRFGPFKSKPSGAWTFHRRQSGCGQVCLTNSPPTSTTGGE